MCQGPGELKWRYLLAWAAMALSLPGCGWNGMGIPAPDVRHFRNDTMRAVAIRAGGLHLFTYADGVKVTLGACEHVLYLPGKYGDAAPVEQASAPTRSGARLELLPATAANEQVQPLAEHTSDESRGVPDERWQHAPPLLSGQRFAGMGLELTRHQAAFRIGASQHLRLWLPRDGNHVLLLMNAGFDPSKSSTFYGVLP